MFVPNELTVSSELNGTTGEHRKWAQPVLCRNMRLLPTSYSLAPEPFEIWSARTEEYWQSYRRLVPWPLLFLCVLRSQASVSLFSRPLSCLSLVIIGTLLLDPRRHDGFWLLLERLDLLAAHCLLLIPSYTISSCTNRSSMDFEKWYNLSWKVTFKTEYNELCRRHLHTGSSWHSWSQDYGSSSGHPNTERLRLLESKPCPISKHS